MNRTTMMTGVVNIIGIHILKILKYSDVTPHNLYLNRRKFLEALGLTSLAFVANPTTAKQSYSTNAKLNTIDEITNYNNFYDGLKFNF